MRRWIAAGFGTGFVPRRLWGGTQGGGTLAALLVSAAGIALWDAPVLAGVALASSATAASLWAAAPWAIDGDDPAWITIDEVAGTAVAMIGLAGWPWLAAVLVARLADIFKVLPGVRQAEMVPGPVGIVADDLVAGGYGLAVGWAVKLLS
jgi:phosphatidylglycerophosphatase A